MSGNGEVIENLAFSYPNIGLLFNPDAPEAAAELAKQVRNARESGELQSVIPLAQGAILATDLLAWPDCPPVLEDNPLSYWLPISDGYTAPTGTPESNGIADFTDIPGKLPNISVGRLAILAAWQIECETKRAASRDEVMAMLQKWATDGSHPETLIKAAKEKRAVEWNTTELKPKIYDIEACGKALKTWIESLT